MTMTKKTNASRSLIRGSRTWLSKPLEAALAWILAFLCLLVSGYHFVRATFIAKLRNTLGLSRQLPWLPLTTTTHHELVRFSSAERLEQLLIVMQALRHESPNARPMSDADALSDEDIVRTIRHDQTCRRLATLALHPKSRLERDPACKDERLMRLKERLTRLWPRLLELPKIDEKLYDHEISLILPCYRERAFEIAGKLDIALANCSDPKTVQVLIVDAGYCEQVDDHIREMTHAWGSISVLKYTEGGGRGSCQNFGAEQASGRILTFCHSDTRLPNDWDLSIRGAFTSSSTQARANSCAFQFGIDLTENGLNGGHIPPGIRAVELTANLRTRLYSLPYGDQCLSIPAAVFHYIGGFPNQCFMEDYELVDLLRRRSRLLSGGGCGVGEELKILAASPPALCSPRRWQQHGVLFVTKTNSKIVNLYASGMTADECYERYYGRAPEIKGDRLNSWEVQLSSWLEQQRVC